MTCTWSPRSDLVSRIYSRTIYTRDEVEAFVSRVELSSRDAQAMAEQWSARGWSLAHAYLVGPALTAYSMFGEKPETCEDVRPYDLGLWYGPDLHRHGLTGARTALTSSV